MRCSRRKNAGEQDVGRSDEKEDEGEDEKEVIDVPPSFPLQRNVCDDYGEE